MSRQFLLRWAWALATGALAPGALAQGSDATASGTAAALPTAAQLCPPADATRGPPGPLVAERLRVQALLNATQPSALDAACQLAWATQQQAVGDALSAAAALVQVIEARAQRSEESAQLLALALPLHQALTAGGPTYEEAALRLAGTIALLHDQRHEMDQAMAWSRRIMAALDAQPQLVDTYTLWSERVNHALRLLDATDYAGATALVQAALAAVGGQPGLETLHANALSALGGLASRQGRWEESARINQETLALRLRALPDDRPGLALAYQNIAVDHHRAGRYDQAETQFRAAIATLRPDDPDVDNFQPTLYSNLGSLLATRGRMQEALAAQQQAYALLQARGATNSPRAAEPLFHAATAQIALGRWGDAARTLRTGLASLGPDGQRASYFSAWGLNMLFGQVMLELGDLREAEAALTRAAAAQAKDAKSPPNLAGQLLTHQAALQQAQGHTAAARQALAEAEATLAKVYAANTKPRLAVLTRRCLLDEAPACDDIRQRLADSDQQRLPPMPVDLEALMALALARQQTDADPASAQPWALRAIAAATTAHAPTVLAQAYLSLAELQRRQGRRDEAIVFAKRSINLVQAMRAGLVSMGSAATTGYLRNKQDGYRHLADWLLEAGRFGEALEVLAQLKVTEQDDFTERADSTAGAKALSLTEREQQLLAQLDQRLAATTDPAADERARQLLGATRLNDAERAQLQQWLDARSTARAQEVQALQALLARTQPPSPRPRSAQAPGPHAPPMALAERPSRRDQLHAHLVWGQGHLNLVTVGHAGQRLQRLPLARQRLDQDIAAFLDALQRRDDVRPLAQQLYRQVGQALDAAARLQGATQITLWLDGGLRYLPFAALHDGRQFLVQKYQLVLAPALAMPAAHTTPTTPTTPSTQPRGGPAVSPAPWQVVAFGVSQALAGQAALPGVDDELCGIVNGPVRGLQHPASRCVGADPAQGSGPMAGQADLNAHFTEQRLRLAIAQSAADPAAAQPQRLLHISTHFTLRPGNILRSSLLLGDGQALSLDTLRSLPMAATELVTLSACQTGLPGTDADGVEVDGLPATLVSRGARRVIASLWRIDDRHTAALMRQFYAELSTRRGDAAAALQAAQLASLRGQLGQPGHPYYWAAFNLTDARR
ncbi:MAG: hypothetical protein CFE45_05515 [Burkholderiales bacterium PBB5]|nr:MAG: hypothetical protein CFE45_05515 [Burkholderiales bacterium PBB5]